MFSVSTQSLVMPLKAARAVSGGRGHRRVQGALVVAQVTLTLVLLVGAGLLIKSFWQLQRVNLGLDSSRVVWFQTRVPANKGFRQVGNQNGMVALEVSPIPGSSSIGCEIGCARSRRRVGGGDQCGARVRCDDAGVVQDRGATDGRRS